MIRLERVDYDNPAHLDWLRMVWGWMEAQPEYLEATGYESLDEFLVQPDGTQWVDMFCWRNETLVGMFSVVLHLPGEYEVHLAIPARPNLRAITIGLEILKRNLFTALQAALVYVILPRGKEAKSARYATFMGFVESSDPRRWELSREQYYGWQKNNDHNQSAANCDLRAGSAAGE